MSEAAASSRVGRPHTPRDFLAALALDPRNVVLSLKVDPEPRAVAKIAAETHGRFGGDRAASVQDVGYAAGWHAKVDGKAIGAQAPRTEFSPQKAAGVDWIQH